MRRKELFTLFSNNETVILYNFKPSARQGATDTCFLYSMMILTGFIFTHAELPQAKKAMCEEELQLWQKISNYMRQHVEVYSNLTTDPTEENNLQLVKNLCHIHSQCLGRKQPTFTGEESSIELTILENSLARNAQASLVNDFISRKFAYISGLDPKTLAKGNATVDQTFSILQIHLANSPLMCNGRFGHHYYTQQPQLIKEGKSSFYAWKPGSRNTTIHQNMFHAIIICGAMIRNNQLLILFADPSIPINTLFAMSLHSFLSNLTNLYSNAFKQSGTTGKEKYPFQAIQDPCRFFFLTNNSSSHVTADHSASTSSASNLPDGDSSTSISNS